MSDHLLRPNADGANTAWNGSISPDWDNVDEAVDPPSTVGFDGNELSISGAAGTSTQDIGFTTATVSGTVSQVVVRARAADQNNNQPASQTTVSVFMGGAWQTAQNSGWTSTEAWHSYTFPGSWSQADVDALEVRLVNTRTGMVIAPMRLKCISVLASDGGGGGGGTASIVPPTGPAQRFMHMLVR